jgi:hypothetical protein
MPSKKQISDAIILWASRLKLSDENRLDEDLLGFTIDQVRVEKIIDEYNITGVIDQNWFLDFGNYEMTKVNIADDPNIDFCVCDISKAQIPSTINLTSLGEGNLDLGLRVISACGKQTYTQYSIEFWKHIPAEHVRSKFPYYQRFGNMIYVNRLINNLRFFGIPETTDGLMLKKTLPVLSGSIKSGSSFTVKGVGSITYNGVIYLPLQSFTATSTKTFTATGTAQVFYTDYQVEMTDKDPYPVSMHMARDIIISILTTELQIEKQQVADTVNDSLDDALK